MQTTENKNSQKHLTNKKVFFFFQKRILLPGYSNDIDDYAYRIQSTSCESG